MSDQSKQNISELMDGELSRDCSRFLLKRMNHDDKFRQSWNHYHILRSAVQQDGQAPLMLDLGSRVVQQLQRESVPEARTLKQNRSWVKAITGSAIAASVALIAVLSFNQNDITSNGLDVMVPEYAKTAKQLINPPNAVTARVEERQRYTRYPDLTPQVQHYIMDKNTQTVVPIYYRVQQVGNPLPVQQTIQNQYNRYTD
ncbi:sigma-E factor negative regulatory protein [Marinicella gelatinilytica]|uniref:sigma-E factor negative regulatory protein n=1 Tax=Marinicella gelatinilytica TaxID=2996017 RepID=UPI00226099E1|nr:sigma-E factor negative regulatory protein [Marinicella gelatinilytica]MCX7544628.1 sigma-E factor negative regulatory protein [Marinicella gelatinilytica]